MSANSEQHPESGGEADEKQLCMNCVSPNEPGAHFCVKCGAPLSSYAAIGPFESLFAEGHVYRQAAERPRNLIVVIGICMIFGTVGLTGAVLVILGRDQGLGYVILGAFGIAISGAIILKTLRNYIIQKRVRKKGDISPPPPPQ